MHSLISSASNVSATGAGSGTLDTSAMTGDYTIECEITGLAQDKRATIAIEDTASATPFDDAVVLATFGVRGPILPGSPVHLSIRSLMLGKVRFGAANNKLRASVLAIDSAAGLSYTARLLT